MKVNIEIAKDNDDWDAHKEINTALIADILNIIIKRYPNFAAIKEIELSVLLTDNARIKTLNKEWRGKNTPTNVLSFPDLEVDFRQILEFKPDLDYIYIGDIAFAYETIDSEGHQKNIEFQQHFIHLLVHSILHLLGYDHQNDIEAKIMEDLEVEILKEMGVESPY